MLTSMLKGRVTTMGFADKLKEASYALLKSLGIEGITLDQFSDPSIREGDYPHPMIWNGKQLCLRTFLQQFGTEICRDIIDQDIWLNALLKRFSCDFDVIVVTDMRFRNELETVVNTVKTHTVVPVFIRRSNSGNSSHSSENSLEASDFKIIIENDSDLESLRKKVLEFATLLIEEK